MITVWPKREESEHFKNEIQNSRLPGRGPDRATVTMTTHIHTCADAYVTFYPTRRSSVVYDTDVYSHFVLYMVLTAQMPHK